MKYKFVLHNDIPVERGGVVRGGQKEWLERVKKIQPTIVKSYESVIKQNPRTLKKITRSSLNTLSQP
jgi:hypothetical protein